MMVTLTPEQVEESASFMPDATLATSFMAPEARARVIALILFAHEIGRARAVVSEAGLGAIRLQWWRDSLEQIYARKPLRAQPNVIALAQAVDESNLPESLFYAMIDGHERELDAAPFETWADVESYLDATFGNFNRLSLLASGLLTLSTKADDAARQSGIAWGLAHLLKNMPLWSSRRCLWLPKAVYSDLDIEGIFAGHVSAKLHACLLQVQGRINEARQQANSDLKTAGLGLHFPAIARACLARQYAKAAIPAIGQQWTVSAPISLLERQIRLTASVARGRI
jgi:phytoene/squalene synthetase